MANFLEKQYIWDNLPHGATIRDRDTNEIILELNIEQKDAIATIIAFECKAFKDRVNHFQKLANQQSVEIGDLQKEIKRLNGIIDKMLD